MRKMYWRHFEDIQIVADMDIGRMNATTSTESRKRIKW